MNSTALVIMAKEPKAGTTKTRLCPPLTPKEAARFYEVLLKDTIELISGINEIDLAIAFTPPTSIEYFERISPSNTNLIPVDCVNIGECLSFSMSRLFEMKYKKVFALNSDGPSLPVTYIRQAIQCLDNSDLVLGPTDDGGYYIVGLKQFQGEIFENIVWSTDQVLSQTLQIAKQHDLSYHNLPSWYDVDTVDGLFKLQAELNELPPDSLPNTRTFLDQWSPKK